MKQNEVNVSKTVSSMEDLEGQGKTAMLVSIDGQYAGLIAVADTVKETSKQATSSLKEMGIKVFVITGYNQRTVNAIGNQVGI